MGNLNPKKRTFSKNSDKDTNQNILKTNNNSTCGLGMHDKQSSHQKVGGRSTARGKQQKKGNLIIGENFVFGESSNINFQSFPNKSGVQNPNPKFVEENFSVEPGGNKVGIDGGGGGNAGATKNGLSYLRRGDDATSSSLLYSVDVLESEHDKNPPSIQTGDGDQRIHTHRSESVHRDYVESERTGDVPASQPSTALGEPSEYDMETGKIQYCITEREREREREMTGESKRKRVVEKEGCIKGEDQMKRKARTAVVDHEVVAPPPTEEEVEEFFAILRRMRVAVKYFEDGASSKIKTGGAPAAAVGGKRVENGGLDLNAVPETESS
ncbi:hypothetical protein BUALT_Bualt07G0080800 [Buddleja alternifolia]|uniref:Uncharacterized protein n=1 Tax=Buddleja alternifolia TaxID=168488 RepID=A0AAV6XAC6_9LAMI|nr:hypothetical protein BUALT_Bualt07G0080800 [Buddleja alternifolia]